MVDILLHVGAHRTGTTSVQKFLYKNREILREHGIDTLFPPATRESKIEIPSTPLPRLLISEENILGTMEGNLLKECLYPDVSEQLQRYRSLFDDVRKIYLSIRNTVDWWSSSISFVSRTGYALPNQSQLRNISNSTRKWSDVIADIRMTIPDAEIVVREFGWKTNNPKQQLSRASKWSELADTFSVKSNNNGRPTLNEMAVAFAKRSDIKSLQNLPSGKYFTPFGKSESEKLDADYFADLQSIGKMTGVKLLAEIDMAKKEAASRKAGQSELTKQVTLKKNKTCLLQIESTGVGYFKSILGTTKLNTEHLLEGSPADTILTTMSEFGRDRKIAFFFRCPKERFISGFLSRVQQGRPENYVNWTPGEAAAFSFFKNPNDLAEALFSPDDRQNSAARFAFASIVNLKNDYVHYLGSRRLLDCERTMSNISVCCETSKIDLHINKIRESMGITLQRVRDEPYNQSVDIGDIHLSEESSRNLEAFWRDEFKIFEFCRSLSSELGYD